MATELELYPRLLIRGMTWRIESFPFQVGRAPCCALRIDDPYLSRVQLEIERGPAGYMLLALGQAEVRLNGNAVQGRSPLVSGDQLAVHGFLATFLAPPPEAATTAAAKPAAPRELPCEIVAEISQPPGPEAARPAPAGRAPGRVGSSRVPVAPDGAPAKHRGATTKRTRVLRVGPLRWQGRSAAAIGGGLLALGVAFAGGLAVARATLSDDDRPTAQARLAEPTPSARAAETPRADGSSPPASPTSRTPTATTLKPREPSSAPSQPSTPPPQRDPVDAPAPPPDDPRPMAPEPMPPADDPVETPPDEGDPTRKSDATEPPRKRHPLDVDEGDEEVEWRGGFRNGSGSGTGGSIDPPPDDPGGKYKDIPILGEEIRAKKIAFVIDRSGSMAKEWWGPVQRELCETIGKLTPDHEFNLYLFSNVYDDYARGWARGTPDEIAKATAWVTAVEARGATDPVPPLLAALSLKGIEALVLLSDIRYKGAKMDEAISLLTRATRGTRTFKPIKLYYFPVEVTEETERISALASGKPAEALRLRLSRK